MKYYSSLLMISLFMFTGMAVNGCGVEIGNPKNPNGDSTKTPTNLMIVDADTVGEYITHQLGTATEAATESLYQAEAALTLTAQTVPLTVSCEEKDPQHIVVQRAGKGAASGQLGRRILDRDYETTVDDSVILNWQSTTATMACANNRAKLDVTQFADLTLDLSLAKNRSHKVLRRTTGETLRQRAIKQSNDLHITFATSPSVLTKTISGKSSQTQSFTSRKLGALTTTTSSEIDPEDPIVIATEYTNKPSDWQTKTIQSGSTTTRDDSEAVMTLKFTNVVLEVASGCLPTSGSISGEIFENTTTTSPTRTFQVAFADDAGTVTFDNGDTVTLDPEQCLWEVATP